MSEAFEEDDLKAKLELLQRENSELRAQIAATREQEWRGLEPSWRGFEVRTFKNEATARRSLALAPPGYRIEHRDKAGSWES